MPSRWVVGPERLTEGDAVLALTLDEVRRAEASGVMSLSFHEVRSTELERAERVVVMVPRWRGNSFLRHLEWLVRARLAEPGAEVSWLVERRVGRRGLESLLGGRGWELRHEIAGRYRQLLGEVPAADTGPEPSPRSFEYDDVRFACDWGVFSEGHIDNGTALLLEVARDEAGAGSCADVGTGCGVLAVLLGRISPTRVVASDVDAVALDLAARNSASAGVDATFVLDDRPESLPSTTLTVCNFPTHASADQTRILVAGLTARTSTGGSALVVVHRSLQTRFIGLFEATGARCSLAAGADHVVLRIES